MGIVIRRQIKWKAIKNQYFRIKDSTFYARMEDGMVHAPSAPMPYALLEVESSTLAEPASMVVAHKLDFQNVWGIYNEGILLASEEVLVAYRPATGISKIFSAFLPRLVFMLYPKGHLERILDPLENDDIVKQKPRRLFYGLKNRF